ncbi:MULTISPECIES: tautomerase family protein [Bradyrhizobium]|jgi:4-oxalocrotonate tautomerase|uniref:tautomerase family protein n=1 Tax=Bradyrhizobium TaxID=374 RepID=UPI0003F5C67E|nr:MULTISPECIES: tautomerase family protein [Bradyrhizobium]KIU48023.1 tautomerase [Bradyrhizobium elkanii]MBK5651846.1 tautomerase family protein [Rhizobium sp.]OCX26837.1 tautomerase [Bradyrhizobium sp. UASWS1016]
MPFLRFDVIEGRGDVEIQRLLDVTHEVLVETLHVPQRDRYQVVHVHPRCQVVALDTGLDIPRTDSLVMLQLTSRPRDKALKLDFYRVLAERLSSACGIAPSDLVINFVINDDEDWSFGMGRAQFMTGELK